MALDRDIALLAQVPILASFPPDALRLLAFSAESRILRTGDVLFRAGEPSDGGYLVVTGSVGLDSRDDGAPIEHVAGPGTLIGETAMFAETTRPATAIARETSSVLLLRARAMRRLLEESPELALQVHRVLAERLRGFTGELGSVRRSLLSIEGP